MALPDPPEPPEPPEPPPPEPFAALLVGAAGFIPAGPVGLMTLLPGVVIAPDLSPISVVLVVVDPSVPSVVMMMVTLQWIEAEADEAPR